MLCKVMFFFNSGSHFFQLIRTDGEILPDDFIVNLCELGQIWHFKIFLIYSSDSQLVCRSKII